MNQVVCGFFAIHGLALPNAKLTAIGNSGCQLESFPEWSKVATIWFPHWHGQKYRRLRCLLCVKGLVICFYLGWSGSILQFKQNIIKVGSKSWLLTCSSNITLSVPSYTGERAKFAILVCCIFDKEYYI